MKRFVEGLFVSPSDLGYFLSCAHRTALELLEAQGFEQRPMFDDPLLKVLRELGEAHEHAYVEALAASGRTLVTIAGVRDRRDAVDRTAAAMRDGADVIVQGALARGQWYGRPDVLIKMPSPSPVLGGWSYEPADTKLARETRGGTILQSGAYCDMLEGVQGIAPEYFAVVTPDDGAQSGGRERVVRRYRTRDYGAYFRWIKTRFERAIARPAREWIGDHYPEPVDHCDICPWSPRCRDRRRADDHLSLVAGITRLQRHELEPRGIATVEALGALAEPMPFKPARGTIESYARVRDQARLQVEARRTGVIGYELISVQPPPRVLLKPGAVAEPVGLARLPEPAPGDVFLDLEGDPLAGESGREYLFGLVTVEDGAVKYTPFWAFSAAEERKAFEAVVDVIMARWARDPGMHVYHYAPYEPSAFKRLMGRHATREREIDQLLRGRRFVDLYAVIRQGVRAGVERYSIKNLEPLYAFTRDVELRAANAALRFMEQALELDGLHAVTPDICAVVQGYNRDDCVSTLRLRDWLEDRRRDLVAAGTEVARPPLVAGEASDELNERAERVEALRTRLLDGVDLTRLADDPEARARYLLAYLLDWHRREDKASWWEYYRLCELPEADLVDEKDAVAGLEFVAEIGREKRSVIHRYGYPPQEMEILRGAKLKSTDGKPFATVCAVDREARRIDIVVGPTRAHLRPTALFAHDKVPIGVLEDGLMSLSERVATEGGVSNLPPGPARALLLRAVPQFTPGGPGPLAARPGESITDVAVRVVTALDRTTLAIQGPPGAGKTYAGARMICALVAAGRKVGVTANSHKVIRNLLDAVAAAAAEQGVDVRIGHKKSGAEATDAGETAEGGVRELGENDEAREAIGAGEINVLGGTAWLWARDQFADAVDVLFIDEAGQMSLANALAISASAKNLVLLGDPQQLDQPVAGTHPDGVSASALEHVLGDAETMPADRGLFLPVTWRLAPSLTEFTSEMFYAGQLRSKPGLERQVLSGNGRFEGSGLFLVEVDHDGNRSASDEEAAAVVDIMRGLLAPASLWIDEHGRESRLTLADILIVAPFNAHVARVEHAWCDRLVADPIDITGALRVGTVDKFQGQEAPVVIYTMATSRPEDAPRGLEFLYSLNRLNVATSRARCVAILVASPRLFEPECRTPRQMQLANALCRFKECATKSPR